MDPDTGLEFRLQAVGVGDLQPDHMAAEANEG